MVQVASFLIIATLIGLNSTTADGEEHHARVRIVGGSHAQAGQFTYQVLLDCLK